MKFLMCKQYPFCEHCCYEFVIAVVIPDHHWTSMRQFWSAFYYVAHFDKQDVGTALNFLVSLKAENFLTCSVTVLIIKPTRCTNFSNLFYNKTLHASDSSSVHHQEFFTVHTAMVYVIQVLLTACDGSCLQAVSKSCMTYSIAVCTVKNSGWRTEELSETCRVLFQNKFEKLNVSSWFYYKNISWYTVIWTSNCSVTVNCFIRTLVHGVSWWACLSIWIRSQLIIRFKYLTAV